MIIIVSAPSGTGKTTIVSRVLKSFKNIRRSISFTTRTTRKGEINGSHYFFISKKEFKEKIKNNEFVEWAKVHNSFYGTSRFFLENALKRYNVVLTIDVQGASKIKKKYKDVISIFLLPPSWKELKRRIEKRGNGDNINLRLKIAKEELKFVSSYDYVVVNNSVMKTVNILKSIIISESCSVNRVKTWKNLMN